MIKSFEELSAIQESCSARLAGKFRGEGGKRAIVLCGGTGCLSSNSAEIREKFSKIIEEKGLSDKVTVNQVGCFGFCSQGPFVKIYPEDTLYRMVHMDDVEEIIEKDIIGGEVVEHLLYVDPATEQKVAKQDDITFYKKQVRIALHGCGSINPEDINEALGDGAFQGLAKALKMDRADVIKEILDSGLRGRGGGGFLTGKKWAQVASFESPKKYIVCNGDEGDPGAFMDRSMMEGDPHRVLEGMIIAGVATGAHEGYIYVRAEYPLAVERLHIAVENAEKNGLLGKNILGSGFDFDISICQGAGAFVCGEGSALTASIEGNRGMPRVKPPRTVEHGLFGMPTVLNNVETFCNVAPIIVNGADWYKTMGPEGNYGTKTFALTGNVNHTGLIEVPMGTSLREIIFDIGGGVKDGEFKAVQIGGPSGGCLCLDAGHLDITLDFDSLKKAGTMIGSGGLVVMNDKTCMVEVARFFMNFTQNESCGKCVPCREGTKRVLELLNDIVEGRGTMEHLELIEELSDTIAATALCGLGKTATSPVRSTLKYFRDEYIAHIKDKKCPAGQCKALLNYHIDPDKCRGCSKCARQCPAGAISGVVKSPFVIDADKCIKCGACMDTCPFKAISRS